MRLEWIGGGYRVSDADAGKLARAVGRRLPPRNRTLSVMMPYGEAAQLTRTTLPPTSAEAYGLRFKVPRRGWVWYVHSNKSLERYTKPPMKRSRPALRRARQAAAHAAKLEKDATVETRFLASGRSFHSVIDEDAAREASDAYLVAADAYEEAGDMLLAMRHREDAKRMRTFAGHESIRTRDPNTKRRVRRLKIRTRGRQRR